MLAALRKRCDRFVYQKYMAYHIRRGYTPNYTSAEIEFDSSLRIENEALEILKKASVERGLDMDALVKHYAALRFIESLSSDLIPDLDMKFFHSPKQKPRLRLIRTRPPVSPTQ
jgi:hypothetical protein